MKERTAANGETEFSWTAAELRASMRADKRRKAEAAKKHATHAQNVERVMRALESIARSLESIASRGVVQ